MNPWRWVYGGKRRALLGPLVDSNGSRNGNLGPYGEAYMGISLKMERGTGRVLEVHYPDGLRLARNPIRALLNPDFKRRPPSTAVSPPSMHSDTAQEMKDGDG